MAETCDMDVEENLAMRDRRLSIPQKLSEVRRVRARSVAITNFAGVEWNSNAIDLLTRDQEEQLFARMQEQSSEMNDEEAKAQERLAASRRLNRPQSMSMFGNFNPAQMQLKSTGNSPLRTSSMPSIKGDKPSKEAESVVTSSTQLFPTLKKTQYATIGGKGLNVEELKKQQEQQVENTSGNSSPQSPFGGFQLKKRTDTDSPSKMPSVTDSQAQMSPSSQLRSIGLRKTSSESSETAKTELSPHSPQTVPLFGLKPTGLRNVETKTNESQAEVPPTQTSPFGQLRPTGLRNTADTVQNNTTTGVNTTPTQGLRTRSHTVHSQSPTSVTNNQFDFKSVLKKKTPEETVVNNKSEVTTTNQTVDTSTLKPSDLRKMFDVKK